MTSHEILDEDDFWHEPTVPDPHWTETSYWGFYIPERRLSGTIYNMWRRNLGLVASRIWIWDPTGDLPTDALYAVMAEHVVIPETADPTNFSLPTGLTCERIAPLRSHRFTFSDPGKLEFDLVTEAMRPPVAAFHTTAPGTGHFDQHIRVRGSLSVWGEELTVDCMSMRDRTWSVRGDYDDDGMRMLGGYMHGATSEDDCWLVMGVGTPDVPGEQSIPAGTGSLVREGKSAMVTGGTRRVTERVDGRPTRLEVEFADELGRSFSATGAALNRLGTMLNPRIFCQWSLYKWTDAEGAVSFGESQECWIPLPTFQQTRARLGR